MSRGLEIQCAVIVRFRINQQSQVLFWVSQREPQTEILDPEELREHVRKWLERITAEGNKMGGVPCIRELRIPVATAVSMVADGVSREEILEAYPDLENEDILQALHYAQL